MRHISIIVPAYNASETIDSCLKAILNLDYPSKLLEVILVNDNSTDNTLELIKAINSQRIRIINNDKNRGRAFTRLRGAQASSHDNLLFIDSRVIIDRSALIAIVKYDEPIQSPLAIKGTDNIWQTALDSLRRLVFKKFYQDKKVTFIDLSNFDNIPKGTGALFIPKNIFVRKSMDIEFGDLNVSDDTKLLFSIVKEGHRIYLNPEFAITYLQRSGLKENIMHLYQRGPKFVDYYYGKHRTYTNIINSALFFIFVLVGSIILDVITIPFLLLILLCLNTVFAILIGKDIFKRGVLFFLFPIISLSFGSGIVKGLLIKGRREVQARWKRSI